MISFKVLQNANIPSKVFKLEDPFKNSKFIEVKLEQPLNIYSVDSRRIISSGKNIFSKDIQPEKAKLALIKFKALIIEIFIFFRLMQSLNILDIDFTFEKSKLVKSTFSKLLQPEKVLLSSMIFFELKSDKFTDINEEQSPNA